VEYYPCAETLIPAGTEWQAIALIHLHMGENFFVENLLEKFSANSLPHPSIYISNKLKEETSS
jgi:hypothetical protein